MRNASLRWARPWESRRNGGLWEAWGPAGEGDRFMEVDAGTLEGDPALRSAITQACRDLEVGLVINPAWPRTRPSDIACAVIPAFARIGLPGPDPRLDALYTAVLPGAVLGSTPGQACAALGLALGIT